MKTILKLIKIESIVMKLSFLQFVEYRMDTVISFIASLIWISGFLLTLEIIFRNIPLVGEWDKWDMILLFSISQFYAGIFFFATNHNMQLLSDAIKSGKFDMLLFKPLNSLFFGTLSRYNINALLVFPIEFAGIFAYAAVNKDFHFTIGNIALFILTLIITCIIGHLISIIFTCVNFWLIDTSMQEAFGLTNDIMQYPMEIISNKYIRWAFLTVIPYALLINVPFRALIGKLSVQLFVLQIVILIVFFVLTVFIWNKGLKAYQSAGS